jgi:hypothetical protein
LKEILLGGVGSIRVTEGRDFKEANVQAPAPEKCSSQGCGSTEEKREVFPCTQPSFSQLLLIQLYAQVIVY